MKLLLIIVFLASCTVSKPVHHITVRIIEVRQVDGGYWIYFRDKIGLYKSFQEIKPDSLYPGKLVNMPKIYKINKIK